MVDRLSPGKVPWDVVADLVPSEMPPEVRLGPAAGEDAALVEIGGELWAVASDPISFTTADAGRLAVIVNANDVAVRGARPRFFLAAVLIAPDEASEERVHELLSQVRETCELVGCSLIGGHTEVTPGISHSIVVGTMLGRVGGRALTTGGLRDGDLVGMTRHAGLEGTAILLAEMGDRLRTSHPQGTVDLTDDLLTSDWMLVVPEALGAAACQGVSALHDVTEGGVGEALYELSVASGLTIQARREDIPVLPETTAICADLGLDPLGLIGSGSLLVGCSPEKGPELQATFAGLGVPFAWIGSAVTSRPQPATTIPRFPRDELLKVGCMDAIEAVIFDMDGTLVNSVYDWPAIRQRLAATGSSIIDDLNALPEPERTRRWNELERIEAEATDRATIHPGARELLDLLGARDIRSALVTNNSEDNTRRLLEKFALDFEVVVTRDSGLWKPSGAPITEAVRQLGVAPERCLGVGDSHYDNIAARNAGLGRICVLHDGSGRRDGDVDLQFDDIPAFLRYLKIVLP